MCTQASTKPASNRCAGRPLLEGSTHGTAPSMHGCMPNYCPTRLRHDTPAQDHVKEQCSRQHAAASLLQLLPAHNTQEVPQKMSAILHQPSTGTVHIVAPCICSVQPIKRANIYRFSGPRWPMLSASHSHPSVPAFRPGVSWVWRSDSVHAGLGHTKHSKNQDPALLQALC